MLKRKRFNLVKKNKNYKELCKFNKRRFQNYLVLIALVAFSLLLVLTNYRSKEYYRNWNKMKKELNSGAIGNRSIEPKAVSISNLNCSVKFCSVTCSGDMSTLNQYLEGQKECAAIDLRIFNGQFPEDKLKNDWLEGSFQLNLLSISESLITGIEGGAFEKSSVVKLKSLELNEVKIQNLNEFSFDGLKLIETLVLVNTVDDFLGKGFLMPMEKSLQKLSIKDRSILPVNPGPWLRIGSFEKLTTIIFDGSNFGSFIDNKTFGHLAGLYFLSLNSCKISYITPGAFDFMMKHPLVLMRLQNNQLQHLNGEYLKHVSSLRTINIEDNPWSCLCQLEELVSEYKRFPAGFGKDVKCKTPPELSGKYLAEINITSCNETMSQETVFLECESLNFPAKQPFCTLELAPADTYFTITKISQTSVELKFGNVIENSYIIWFYEKPSATHLSKSLQTVGKLKVGCKNNHEELLIVEDLFQNQVYTFCLVNEFARFVSPFNCQSYCSIQNPNNNCEVQPNCHIKIWIVIMIIIVSFCIGAAGMFLVLRFKPRLLNYSKRAVVAEQGEKVLVIPRPKIKTSLTGSCNLNSISADVDCFPRRLSDASIESSHSYMMANYYEEIDYYLKMHDPKDTILANRVPMSPPPSLPLPRRTRKSSIKSRRNDDGYI